MFRCQPCGKSSLLGEKRHLRVMEERGKIYPYRKGVMPPASGSTRRRDDPGGEGWEIGRTEQVCPRCVCEGELA